MMNISEILPRNLLTKQAIYFTIIVQRVIVFDALRKHNNNFVNYGI